MSCAFCLPMLIISSPTEKLVTDELWEMIELLLPDEPPKPKGGRPRIDDRAALTGILFVLKSGIPWEMLPQEMGCGSGMTCWRRLRNWQAAGIWERIHQTLLSRLSERGATDWSRVALDSASVPAKKGATQPVRIRRIEANRVRNTMSWSKLKAFRWRSRSQQRMCMTAGSLKRSWMPYQRSKDLKDSCASVRTSCVRTKRTTLPTVDGRCDSAESKVASPGAASSPARGWGGTVGSWSAR